MTAEREVLFSLDRDDFEFSYFRAGGKGGQKQNKTASACRVKHEPSGAVAESRVHREQLQNRRSAWKKCIEQPAFQVWLTRKIARETMSAQERQRQDERIQQELSSDRVQVEVREDGKWVVQQVGGRLIAARHSQVDS